MMKVHELIDQDQNVLAEGAVSEEEAIYWGELISKDEALFEKVRNAKVVGEAMSAEEFIATYLT